MKSIKILHTADWHIKLGQKNVPRDWALNRYRIFFEKVHNLEENYDLHIINGDIFDRTPTLEELEVFWDFIACCRIPTLINTGNHESETKKKSFLTRLKYPCHLINPEVHIVDQISTSAHYGFYDFPFYVVPYECIKSEDNWKQLDPVPVFTHVRGEIPPHVKPEIPLEWLDKFPVVFAGDLHSHQNTQRNICYPGSPMTTSFHREITKNANGYHSIELFTDGSTVVEWEDFKLPQLIRKTVTNQDDIVPTEFHHTIYELEGSLEDVSVKVENDLLDKKIVKRSSEATLHLSEKMTMEDELKEYLEFVLEIDDKDKILEVYHEHSKAD